MVKVQTKILSSTPVSQCCSQIKVWTSLKKPFYCLVITVRWKTPFGGFLMGLCQCKRTLAYEEPRSSDNPEVSQIHLAISTNLIAFCIGTVFGFVMGGSFRSFQFKKMPLKLSQQKNTHLPQIHHPLLSFNILDFLLFSNFLFWIFFSIVSSFIFCLIRHSNVRFYFHLSSSLFLPFLSLFSYFPPLYLTVEINSFRSLFSFAW